MNSPKKDKIRYGVVGAGWISQSVFMPGVANTENSVITALVTGDPVKAEKLSKLYDIPYSCGYDGYEELLTSGKVDALYMALPNFMHAEYTIPALEAGIPVLLEKPMAVSEEECNRINEAAKRGNAKLMVAYRLHFEPATLDAIERVRKGEIGNARFFSAVMGQTVEKANHRAKNGFWAGPVADMGPYPLNAARNLFEAEPIEVMALGIKTPHLGFDFHDTVTVTLVFPGERLAQFTVSYASAQVGTYRIVGDKADLEITPGFNWGKPIKHNLTKEGKTETKSYDETDQFGGETQYFSECILKGVEPEPGGDEGLADVRVIAAIEQSLKTGQPQKLIPFSRKRRPQPDQAVKLPPVKDGKLINAHTPSGK